MPDVPQTSQYQRHRGGGRDRACVTLDGRRVYLGRYGSEESHRKYDQVMAEWLASGRRRPVAADELSVVELSARFLEYAQRVYRKPDGTPTSTTSNYAAVIKPLCRLSTPLVGPPPQP